jgi:hypothetical protein
MVVYDGDHLVWETSQTMAGIPYGDCFSVEVRWDFTPAGGPDGMCVQVHIMVPFSKRCLFKVRRCVGRCVGRCSGRWPPPSPGRSAAAAWPAPGARRRSVRLRPPC